MNASGLTGGFANRARRRLLCNEEHRIIYCPIEKNSCTFFKQILVDNSRYAQPYRDSGLPVHDYLKQEPILRIDTLDKLASDEYLKFVVVREPIERIVSAYLNKFVTNRASPMAVKATADYEQMFELDKPLRRLLTFHEFSRLICRQRDRDMDVHWRPQEFFVRGFLDKFDWIVPMNAIPEFLCVLEGRMGVTLPRGRTANQTSYAQLDNDELFDKKTPEELRAMEGLPRKDKLVNERMLERLSQRYRHDIELYQQAERCSEQSLKGESAS